MSVASATNIDIVSSVADKRWESWRRGGIPVFVAGPLYCMAVRLRYRLRAGAIEWFFELYRSDLVFESAFKEACEEASNSTGVPLFLGSPEK